jgi:hypothetical protein
MKFSGPVLKNNSLSIKLCTNNFGAGVSNQVASRGCPWAENRLFLENISRTVCTKIIYLKIYFCFNEWLNNTI